MIELGHGRRGAVPHLLLIDDDADVRHLINAYGLAMGWTVTTAADGASGLHLLRTTPVDVVVLDILLPDQPGWAVLQAIRRESPVYVLMLSVLGTEADRIGGLAQGADDYLVKPFSPGELWARLQALLRRPRSLMTAASDAPTSPLILDRERHEVRYQGTPVTLTALEFRLLDTLARHPGRVFTRDQLVEAALGWNYAGYDRVIDVHIGHIRRKLGDTPAHPQVIETIRGVGYRLVADHAP